MFNNRMNGLLLGASIVALLAGCSSTKDPFLARTQRPVEQCMPGTYQNQGNPQDAFGDRHVLRYVVKKGDTLWDISKRFLVKPWYWKKLWYNNPQIRNPHLIYPGDVLGIVDVGGEKRIGIIEAGEYHGVDTGRQTKDGRKIYKYNPGYREYNFHDLPITILNKVVAPFVLKTEIMTPQQVQSLPFIFGDAGDYLTLTQQQTFYSRNLPSGVENFSIYRPVGNFVANMDQVDKGKHPIIAQEMQYIGEVEVGERDAQGITKLHPIDVAQNILEHDVLVPSVPEEDFDYFPQIPSSNCNRGYILSNTNKTTTNIKEFDTIVTSFGQDNGAQVGDVWKIVRPGPMRELQGQMVQIPHKEIGYLMIIKVYPNYSLGFVLDSQQNIDVTDWIVRP